MPPASPGTGTSPIIQRACLNHITTAPPPPPPPLPLHPQVPSHMLEWEINTQLPIGEPSVNDAIHQRCANGAVTLYSLRVH